MSPHDPSVDCGACWECLSKTAVDTMASELRQVQLEAERIRRERDEAMAALAETKRKMELLSKQDQ